MLAQPAQALTDLLLGLVVATLAVRLHRRGNISRPWQSAFGWTAAAALAGSVHHAVLVRWTRWGSFSWAVITVMIVIAVSYLLAGTVVEVLGSGHARTFWLLRSVGLVAYVVLAFTGHAGVASMMSCEGLTMTSVLVLWCWATYRHHPLGWPVLLAIAASGAAGATQALSPSVTHWIDLDPTSTYHLAQVVGMAVLYWALTRPRTGDALSGGRHTGEQGPAVQAG
ncbi:hypothetical protein GCM10023322_37820 [Rugosimonospora acidiphila]|uniref:Integral membrane protein n=1 Tax=Rugosimonospora acidiphila TaxID=556531 RepID=A0ABP9RWW5_9ACTN